MALMLKKSADDSLSEGYIIDGLFSNPSSNSGIIVLIFIK